MDNPINNKYSRMLLHAIVFLLLYIYILKFMYLLNYFLYKSTCL